MQSNKNDSNPILYLNTAGVGLVSRASVSRAVRFQEGLTTNASGTFIPWIMGVLPELRQKVAQLLHTEASCIAFTPNFTYSIMAVMDSLRPSVKKVLLYTDDYPSLTMPFELGGFDVVTVESPDGFEVPIDRIRETALKEKVQAVVISHVQFLTGFTIDLNELGSFCKENDITLIVDATQSMGAVEMNFDEMNADVLISSSYKWLNGGPGSAVCAVKKSFLERYPPKFAGFGSLTQDEKGWSYQSSVTSYEGGHLNAAGLLQLEEAVDRRLLVGIPYIQEHNHALIQQLTKGLSETSFGIAGGYGAEHLSTILCVAADQEVHDFLTGRNIVTTWRKGMIRVSPHFYNTAAEIDTFIGMLKEWDSLKKI